MIQGSDIDSSGERQVPDTTYRPNECCSQVHNPSAILAAFKLACVVQIGYIPGTGKFNKMIANMAPCRPVNTEMERWRNVLPARNSAIS